MDNSSWIYFLRLVSLDAGVRRGGAALVLEGYSYTSRFDAT
jgi:hypothetical protein